jgi:type II secretory pathway pseudopilin PulG
MLELLVVISIIAVLAAIATPVTGRVINQARKADCNQQMANILTAIKAYQLEYGHIPIKSGAIEGTVLRTDSGDGRALMKCLIGENTTTFANPKLILFYEPTYTSSRRGGWDATMGSEGLYDPWGNPFEILLDHNFDRTIDPTPLDSGSTAPVRKDVLILSRGKDKDPAAVGDDLFSWKNK